MQLIEALRYSNHKSVAFVGAGGKTTAIFRLAREILSSQKPDSISSTVLVTTTTHFGTWQLGQADHSYHVSSQGSIEKLKSTLPSGIVMLIGEEYGDRVQGLNARHLHEVYKLAEDRGLSLLIEADGAHLHPIKAPAMNEPVIPECVEYVVVVAGLSGLGKVLSGESVHRPRVFGRLAGLHFGDVVTREALTRMLLNREGGFKNIPQAAQKAVLLNQVDTAELNSDAVLMAERLVQAYPSVIIASLFPHGGVTLHAAEKSFEHEDEVSQVIEPIAGIILAAGESSRIGQPKQLLQWRGQPLIRHVVLSAKQSGLDEIIVVVGSCAAEVSSVLSDLPLRIVMNPGWTEGVSTSIRAGLASLRGEFGAVIFFQADQPQIPVDLIHELVQVHQKSLSAIVAPQIQGQRGNPVLFDRRVFPELMKLQGDKGGRMLFTNFPVEMVSWPDEKLLLDIDTMSDYQNFLNVYSDREGTC
jgi:molybdenum cofactor cytidylyltransferase